MIFIDGNNWYHALRSARVQNLGRLNYRRISQKLLGPRHWVGTRYYIGRCHQEGDPQLYANQRRFLASLQATDRRITCHLGRLESRTVTNEAAEEILRYLAGMPVKIDKAVFQDLMKLATKHRSTSVLVEKAVDVMLAVDMAMMAHRGEYDAAYILSADGDFTPAVSAVRGLGKRVYAASPAPGAQLAAAVNTSIRLTSSWFDDCFSS
jgi:uncharacterized LabA/DUF88 family protein